MAAADIGRVAVVGAGSWGTTVAALLAPRVDTVLWSRRPEVAEEITTRRCNGAYLPSVVLPTELAATACLADAVRGADLVVVAVPSHGFRAVLADAAPDVGD